MNVKKILAKKGTIVYSIQANARIPDAAKLMNEKRIGSLIVLDENQNLQGIVTERDILRKCAVAGGDFQATRVKDIMTPKDKLIRGSIENDVRYLMSTMTANSIRHVPIMDGEKVVGVVSIRDVIRLLLEDAEFEKKILAEYMSGTDLG